MSRTIHLVEPTGYSGIFQHTVALAEALGSTGERVVLHTAREHESLPAVGFRYCPCGTWPQRTPASFKRRIELGGHYLGPMLSHISSAVGPGDIVHLQGNLAGVVSLVAVRRIRRTSARMVCTPHESFLDRSRLDAACLSLALRSADAVVVFSQHDVDALASRGLVARLSPLVLKAPPPDPTLVRAWRRRWGAEVGAEVVLFAGEIREEKRLDTLIRAAANWPHRRRLAVVGRDRQGWSHSSELARSLGVEVKATIAFVELQDFVSAITAADVCALPYEVANQSGVATIARQVGAHTIGSRVGGLPELVEASFAPGSTEGLNVELDRVLALPRPQPQPPDALGLVRAHARAYLLDAEPDWAGRAVRAQVA